MADPIKSAKEAAAQLAAKLSVPRPMRRGWVGERWMKCGQPNCHCHTDPKARHGPYVALTLPQAGKTSSRYLPKECLPLVREQVAAMKQFRGDVQAVMQVAEQWADEELEAAIGSEAGEKKSSRAVLLRKSSRKLNG